MIHPDTELQFISDEIGYGIVATKRIPKGTITWALDALDREFTPKQVEKMSGVYRDIVLKYCYRNNKGNHVLCWDLSRFVNHSFKSNCITTAYDFEIAVRDIEPGEQLTDDYGYLNIEESFFAENEGTERQVVQPDDLLHYHAQWDKQLLESFPLLAKVKQPLQPILKPKTWETAVNVSKGKTKMKSILTCYYNPVLVE